MFYFATNLESCDVVVNEATIASNVLVKLAADGVLLQIFCLALPLQVVLNLCFGSSLWMCVRLVCLGPACSFFDYVG
jgi:hypothetical protein